MDTRIITGDSLAVLKEMPDQRVNCVITSPPYYGLRDYGIEGQIGLEESPDEYIEKMVEVFREVRRVLKDDGTLWLNIGDSYAGNCSRASNNGRAGFGNPRETITSRVPSGTKPKDLIGIPWLLAFALRADGWYLRQDIIWHKPNPLPESVKDRCTKSHEYIFLLSKSPKYYFDYEAIKEPRNAKEKGESRTYRGGVYTNGNTFNNSAKIERTSHGNKPASSNLRNKRDVWNIAVRPYKGAHFATFPEALVEPCLLAGCPEGGTALDPFSGAGTVGVVCKKKGRNYVGIELNPEYAQLQADRIASTNVEEETDKDEEQIPGQMNLDEFNIAN